MSQYALSLSLPAVFSADNFIVSACNRDAWHWINIWPAWPTHALILAGPEGSGKSHLGQLWAQRAKASVIAANVLDNMAVTQPGNWLLEDIETLKDERLLFHLFNATKENSNYVLMTSSLPPAQLPFTLPDLTSRLRAATTVIIEHPDDEVLAGAMRKQFADRQMKVDEEIISYILPRVERSLGAVKALVETLDKETLEKRKNLTVPFVKRLLESHAQPTYDSGV